MPEKKTSTASIPSRLRFTGGDQLGGFSKLVHKTLMLNELQNEMCAYEIHYAQIGKSGYSFGGNQMDLLNNASSRLVFWEILASQGLTGEAIKNIFQKVTQPGKNLDSKDEVLINAALSSDFGVKKLNEAYVCIFQRKPIGDSVLNRSTIPVQIDQ